MKTSRALALSALLLGSTGAFAQQTVILGAPSRTAVAKAQVAMITAQGAGLIDLGALAADSLKSMGSAKSSTEGARQIGLERQVGAAAAASMSWTSIAGGSLTGQVAVRSPGAAAIRLAVALRDAPAGARVRFSDAAGTVVHSAEATDIAAATRSWGAYWGPVTTGAEQLVQIELPAGSAVTGGMLAVKSVSHLLSDPSTSAPPVGGAKAAGTCQRDVSCTARTDEAVAKAARSVAKIAYTVDGKTYACTGTLVNSGGSSQVPYMLTAKHCIGSAAAAATVNTFWFLEAGSCGGSAAASQVQLSRGATLAYAGALSDVALIRLNEPAPANAWFSGIDASALTANDAAIALHHPAGDLKKLSSGRVIEPSASTTLMSVAWLSGTTEPGSSGSGLFTQRGGEYVLRGTLRGGSASCTNSGSLADDTNRDFYARLDGDTQAIATLLKAGTEPSENYSDMWASTTDAGTGLSITHRVVTNAMFVVSFAYAADGSASWIMAQGGEWLSATTFTAPAYRATRNGTAVSQAPIGTVTLTFEGGRVTMVSKLEGLAERSAQFQRHVF